MANKYFNLEDLHEDLLECFRERSMFLEISQMDVVSFLPIEDKTVAKELVDKTNQVLRDYMDSQEIEGFQEFSENSCEEAIENPIFFWKDYLSCFFDFELIDDEGLYEEFLGTQFGIYRATRVLFIDEVNRRFRNRKLLGLNLAYQVLPSSSDKKNFWERS